MTLEQFVLDWLDSSPLRPAGDPYQQAGGNVGITLYRDDRFQVQLWAFPPRAVVSEHSHPDLDSWLIKVTGKFRMTLDGKELSPKDATRAKWRGMNTWMTRVPPGAVHGVRLGEGGGSFLSIAERLDGRPPQSVHLNWSGDALDPTHMLELGAS